MAAIPKTVTAEKQYEINVQLDKELGTTIKRFKKLEADREKKNDGLKAIKSLKVLELFRKENYDVISDVLISRSGDKKLKDERTYFELNDLLQDHDAYDSMLQEKKSYLKEINDAIKKEQTKIAVISRQVPSNVQWQERGQRGEKTLEALENKLDTFVKQYGLVSTESRVLREEVEHMLIERMTFNKLWYSLIHNLSTGKKILMDILEQAMIAYNSRDEYIVRLNALRSLAMSDLTHNTQEMEDLQKRLDHDRQIEDFMTLKQQFRHMKDLTEKKNQKRVDNRLKIKERLMHHKELLQQIETFTGVECQPNIAEFAAQFRACEIENLSIFNYINDLHNELERANTELIYTRLEIEKQRILSQKRQVQQKRTLEALKAGLQVKTKEATDAQKGLDGINKVLKKLYLGLEELCKLCKCGNAPFVELLGENTRISDYNVLLYLKVLEDSVGSYLSNVYYKEKVEVGTRKQLKAAVNVIDESVRPLVRYHVQEFCKSNPCPLCVDREMVSDVIDTLQFAETRPEVKARLETRLELPDGLDRLHNVSLCNLPKSRQIIQRRYQ